jgi:hypothetical protein
MTKEEARIAGGACQRKIGKGIAGIEPAKIRDFTNNRRKFRSQTSDNMER